MKIKYRTKNPDDDIHKDIDTLILNKNKDTSELLGKSEQMQRTYDNLYFRKQFRDNPIMTKKNYHVYGVETVSLSEFLALRMWPRSIYVTDKLLRLVASSKYEALKRYLSKKRTMPLNMLWIILIIVGVILAVVVIILLLPKFTGG